MTANSMHITKVDHQRWLVLLLAAALSVAGPGCVDANGEGLEAPSPDAPASADEPIVTALRRGAFATPQAVGGFCSHGMGVYLSAVNNTAELTLYVVAPRSSATFGRPALYVTTRAGDYTQTETVEFDDVTLSAGDSHVLRKEAQGTLVEVFADFVGARQ